MLEIQVPLMVTPEPVTTVEQAVLPPPPDVTPDTLPAEGMRVTISVQNALNEEAPTDPRAGADAGATEPAPADPAPAEPTAAVADTAYAAAYDTASTH